MLDSLNEVSIEQVIISLTGVATALSVLITLSIKIKKEIINSCNSKTIIGVVGELPLCLSKLPDYTSLFKARNSSQDFVILHCKNLSYALRKCDFVCSEIGKDPKIKSAKDINFWSAIIDN